MSAVPRMEFNGLAVKVRKRNPSARPASVLAVMVLFFIACGFPASSRGAGALVEWGSSQTNSPAGLANITAISTALDHSLALTTAGAVLAWGDNSDGQCDIPTNLDGAIAISAGPFVSMAVRPDSTVVAWGDNEFDQCHVPPSLTNVVSVSAGRSHALALRSDGSVVAWGDNSYDQCDIPFGLTGVKAVVAGWDYSLALRSNGTVAAWGADDAGQTDVPSDLSGVVAIAGNIDYCLAVTSGGTVVGWGDPPAIPPGLNGVINVAAGEDHCLALKSDGTVVAWGDDLVGQAEVPATAANASAVGAAWHYSVALVAPTPGTDQLLLANPSWSSGAFSVSVPTRNGASYTLEYKNSLSNTTWTALQPVSGAGTALELTDPKAGGMGRFYRVKRSP